MTVTATTDRVQTDVRNAIAALLRSVVQLAVSSSAIAVTPVSGGTGGTFTRSDAGSFLDDGFVDGAELSTVGFVNAANNGLAYIQTVSDTALIVTQAPNATPLITEDAGAAVTLSLKYPSQRDLSRGFVATPGVPWARLTLLRGPNASRRANVGIDPTRIHTGYAQVSLFYPRDTGANAADSMADAVREAAEANEVLSFNGRTIYLLEMNGGRQAVGPTVLSPQFEPDWYHVPVRIPYYLFD